MAQQKEQSGYSRELLYDLVEGKLDSKSLKELQAGEKNTDRFEKILEIEQSRVPWKEKIIASLAEHLYIILKGSDRIIKCSCGYEFGDYRHNWKLKSLIYERNPQDGEIYVGPRAPDANWAVLREFYCPGCGTQLEVELVPHGHPIIFDAELDIDGFYDRRPELKKKVFEE